MAGTRALTLGALERLGVRQLRFCCIRQDCDWSYPLPLDRLVQRYGKGCSLRALARAARCRTCRRRGAHVEPFGFGLSRQDLDDGRAVGRVFEAQRARADKGFLYGYPDRRGRPKRGGEP